MENIYILDHDSTDGSTENLECNIESIGNTITDKLSFNRKFIYDTLINKHIELLKEYEFVISVDADEIIFVPTEFGNLRNYVEVKRDTIQSCRGYEIIQQKDEDELN